MTPRSVTIFTFALAAVFLGCSSPARRERSELARHFQQLEAQAPAVVVDPSDGISEVEAYKIACDYFSSTLMGCGAVGLPQEEPASWRVAIFEGYAGMHTKDVVVSQRDGSYSVVINSLK